MFPGQNNGFGNFARDDGGGAGIVSGLPGPGAFGVIGCGATGAICDYGFGVVLRQRDSAGGGIVGYLNHFIVFWVVYIARCGRIFTEPPGFLKYLTFTLGHGEAALHGGTIALEQFALVVFNQRIGNLKVELKGSSGVMHAVEYRRFYFAGCDGVGRRCRHGRGRRHWATACPPRDRAGCG